MVDGIGKTNLVRNRELVEVYFAISENLIC